MKPDGAERLFFSELVVPKPCIHWREASGVFMLLAPADPASVEPRFGN